MPISYGPRPPFLIDNVGNTAATLKLTLRGLIYGQIVMNNYHWARLTGVSGSPPFPISLTEMKSLISQFQTSYINPLDALLSHDLVWTDWLVTEEEHFVYASVPIPLQAGFTQPAVGTVSVPQNVAVCISRYSIVRGRRGRGRTFIPGIPAAATLSGQIAAGSQAAWDAVAADEIDPITTASGTWTLIVTPGKLLPIAEPNPPNEAQLRGSPVVSTKAQPVLRTQRRRNIGRGI